ncbi:Tol-Pal system protein TolQ [Candidatus Magnetaquicoccaceae bacterium FCR-1]|uniref:Tol-Pal system protein TolQ n=1 Tax=Candidatus Magnetaquiglobus chichijimensis TaxID=3141448 RepID=A0ABQ0C6W8_9PROT
MGAGFGEHHPIKGKTLNESVSWLAWWVHADGVVKGIFLLLIALSIGGWTIILHKWNRFQGALKRERRIRHALDAGEPVVSSEALLGACLPDTRTGAALGEARIAVAVREERIELESGLTFLASIGVSTPFIGLLGTVWGIMHALSGLGHGSALSLDLVAGPVAEALVATAAGLFAAIPAAVGYNMLVRRLRRLMTLAEGNLLRLTALRAGDGRGHLA